MPTERDIRETRDLLEGRLGRGHRKCSASSGGCPPGEQTRIFSPGGQRRVIVATNIAETSLTIPRIRYVIDTGPGAHQPLQPAHAHQAAARRAGLPEQREPARGPRGPRAGRRLHPALRPGGFRETPALHPAGNPARQPRGSHPAHEGVPARRDRDVPVPRTRRCRPRSAPVTSCCTNSARSTTPTRSPRSAANWRGCRSTRRWAGCCSRRAQERALPEVLVIAAGLSVPDPRERPEDEKEAAAAAHRAFDGRRTRIFSSLLQHLARDARERRAATRCAGSPRRIIFRRPGCANGATSTANSPTRWRATDAKPAARLPHPPEHATRRFTARSSPACSGRSPSARNAISTRHPATGR